MLIRVICIDRRSPLSRHHPNRSWLRVGTRKPRPEKADAASPRNGFVPIKCRPPDQSSGPTSYIVGPDALALVRFGAPEGVLLFMFALELAGGLAVFAVRPSAQRLT